MIGDVEIPAALLAQFSFDVPKLIRLRISRLRFSGRR
jgi:hypothetical protein